MDVFLYKMEKGKLTPAESGGDFVVVVDKMNVKVYRRDGSEIKDYEFSLLGNERILLEKLRYLEEVSGFKVDEGYALAYPDVKKRVLKLNQLIGYVFEEYVWSILSRYFNVERNPQIYVSLTKFGVKSHNRPDFVIEGKVAIEAKTGDYSKEQIMEYERKYPIGAVVFPWTGNCKTVRWNCFYYFVKDHERLIDWIGIYLSK